MVGTHANSTQEEKENVTLFLNVVVPLTLCRRFYIGEPLSLQHLVEAIVGDFQDKTAVHNAVAGLQASVAHSAVVKVLHSLRQETRYTLL